MVPFRRPVTLCLQMLSNLVNIFQFEVLVSVSFLKAFIKNAVMEKTKINTYWSIVI